VYTFSLVEFFEVDGLVRFGGGDMILLILLLFLSEWRSPLYLRLIK
jgi:hypothetical protein